MKLLLTTASLLLALSASSYAKDQINIVGSSTVYPFTTSVAEQYSRATGAPAPVVESTGTGGGIKLFCAGVDETTPDVVNASRRMKKSEFETCQKNGVTDIVEIKIGFDGIVLAHSTSTEFPGLTKTQILTALADIEGGKPEKWNDISPSLPDTKIEVLGPPPTSGTRDAFHELVMAPGLALTPSVSLQTSDPAKYESIWKSMRTDGAYIEAGENDNLIVQKIEANPTAIGIFGYSFLEENLGQIKAIPIDGVEPTYETIASGEYTVSRPLYIYVKAQHIEIIPALKDFIAEYVSDAAIGEDGYLTGKGLIPLPADQLEISKAGATNLTSLKIDGLH